ncbi:hypothetical protein AB0M95_17405 [Sphaerisporangium sp. NPDC051017]
MVKGFGREKVRKLLGMAVWEVELAVDGEVWRDLAAPQSASSGESENP